MYKISLS